MSFINLGPKRSRSKPRPGRLKGLKLKVLREECWKRDKGICQQCFEPVLDGIWHMAHVRNKRMYGDSLENVRVKHPYCHMVLEHNPKSVPAKEKIDVGQY